MRGILKMCCCIVALAAASTAAAEVMPGRWSLTPVVGGYLFAGTEHLRTHPLYGLRIGNDLTKNFGVEALVQNVATEGTRFGNHVNSLSYGLEGLYRFMPDSKLVPHVAAGFRGISYYNLPNRGTESDAAFDYGLGLSYSMMQNLALRADVRHVLVFERTRNNLEYYAGLGFFFGGGSPKVAAIEPSPPKVEEVAVVTPVVDSDADGVPDDRDRCPDTPKRVKVDVSGCPQDSDADGVADYLDKCPGTPRGVVVDVAGCPQDSDRDGVSDYLDKCPGTPQGVKVTANGCPQDSDADGVADYLDKCPRTPQGVKVDSNGCPKQKPTISLNLRFDTNRANVKEHYHDEIAAVADFMKKYPGATVAIEGHTDSVGKRESNLKLSQRRAESVKAYLVDRFGIDEARITTAGYGEARPVADNETPEGREANRRIEAVFTVPEE